MTESRCMVCGGLMVKQLTWNGCHRFKDDCIAHLRLAVKQMEPRAAFGDQCYQDRCENAYVEQSVVKRLESVIEEVINDVEDCGPKAKYKLFKALQGSALAG